MPATLPPSKQIGKLVIHTLVSPTRDNDYMADLIQSLPTIMLAVLAALGLMMVVFGSLLASFAARRGDQWRTVGGAYVCLLYTSDAADE